MTRSELPFDSVVATGKGDDGTTGLLFGGARVRKDDPRTDAYGTVDEAVAALGLARAELGAMADDASSPDFGDLAGLILRIQRELFVVGAELATAPENRTKLRPETSLVTTEMVTRLEPIIDDITSLFEAPKEFVLPGQNRVAATLDFARTVIRRAERVSVAATRVGWLGADSQVVPYLNRLADLVYTLSRWQEGDFRPSRKP
jgi:cob(I)alamin adenosyltransferase